MGEEDAEVGKQFALDLVPNGAERLEQGGVGRDCHLSICKQIRIFGRGAEFHGGSSYPGIETRALIASKRADRIKPCFYPADNSLTDFAVEIAREESPCALADTFDNWRLERMQRWPADCHQRIYDVHMHAGSNEIVEQCIHNWDNLDPADSLLREFADECMDVRVVQSAQQGRHQGHDAASDEFRR